MPQVVSCMHDSVLVPENLREHSSILMPGFHYDTSIGIVVVRAFATQA